MTGRVVVVEVGRPAPEPIVRWWATTVPTASPAPDRHVVDVVWTETGFVPADPVLRRPAVLPRATVDARCRSCRAHGALAIDVLYAADPVARERAEEILAEALHRGAR